MHSQMIRILGHTCLFASLFFLPALARAQANFVSPGQFMVLTPCQAHNAISNPGSSVDLVVDQTYVAHAENKAASGTHSLISVDGRRMWVSLACGDYAGERPPFVGGGGGGGSGGGSGSCAPFFDSENNPVAVGVGGLVDITPIAPPIEPFGRAVNEFCGAPGKATDKAEFVQLMKSRPQVLAELMAFTGGKVFANRPRHADADDYLRDLAEAWYELKGFDHIFCGEPKAGGSIGGLHYQGRYQQLQESGDACRLPNLSKNEVVPGSIYSTGVRMKAANGSWAESTIKGYGLTLSAAEILQAATRAFAENPTSNTSSTGCMLALSDGDVSFDAVFVRRAAGIRTFFPDATPDFNRNPRCSKPIVLADTGGGGEEICGADGNSLVAGDFRVKVLSSDAQGFVLRVDKCTP